MARRYAPFAAALAMLLALAFAGRTLGLGALIKIVALVLRVLLPGSTPAGVLDTLGDILIVVAALTIGYYLFIDVKRLVLCFYSKPLYRRAAILFREKFNTCTLVQSSDS